MKFFHWMHHKLQQINIDPCNDVPIVSGNFCTCLTAQPSLSDQLLSPKQSFGSRPINQTQKACQQSVVECGAKKVEEDFEEESPNNISDLFQGFLTIGTLGMEPFSQELETPKFSTSFENTTEKGTEATENDKKLINDQLEKFLETEVKTEKCKETSRRNSHVSNITLGSKQVKGTCIKADADWKLEVCPLQGYLFGSAIELPESRLGAKKDKASLGELFQRTKTADELSTMKCEKAELQGKRRNKSPMNLMKKIFKKLHTLPRSSTGNDAADSVSNTTKLHKIQDIFHKKIHPEATMAAKECKESHTNESKDTPYISDYARGDLKFLDEDNKRFPQIHVSKERFYGHKANFNLPQNRLGNSGTEGNSGHWIKTDPDCKPCAGALEEENHKRKLPTVIL